MDSPTISWDVHRNSIDLEPRDINLMYREQITAGLEASFDKFESLSNEESIERFESGSRDEKILVLFESLERADQPDILSFLIETLHQTSDPQLGVLTMIALGENGTKQALEEIVAVLEDPEYPEWLIPGINLLEQFEPNDRVLEILVELLSHNWDEIKFHSAMALSRLWDLSDRTLISKLKPLLNDDTNTSTLYYLVLLLKEARVEGGIPLLEDLLEKDPVSYFAIEALGEIGGDTAQSLLAEQLQSDDPIRLFYTAEALGKLGDKEHWDRLEKLARSHKDRNVRYYSMRSLHQIDPDRSVEVLLNRLQDEDPEIRNYASRSLIEFGDVVISPYREALDSDDRKAVKEALYVLGEIGDEQVLDDLLAKAYSADKEIEHTALESLQTMARDSEHCRRWLLEQLPESDNNLKRNILRILEGLGNSELCSYLSRFLTADDTKLRYYTVGICRSQDSPECLHLLGRFCEDENLQVASYAVNTLTSIRTASSRKLARELVQEELRPLVLISYLRGFFLDRAPEFQKPVEEILKQSNDSRLRYYAACALKAIQPSRLKTLAETNQYLEKVHDRIRVN